MTRHLSRPAAVGLIAVTVLPAAARAALTIDLRLPNNATTAFIGRDQTNANVPIQVWATVTGSTPISPVPAPGPSTTPPATTGDFDGLRYLFYNVRNASVPGTYIAGGIASAPLNPTLGFNAGGSNPGQLQNVTGGLSVGSATDPAATAQPRAARNVFDNYAAFNAATGLYTTYGGDNANIRINSPTSVSFLVQTLNFRPAAYAQRNQTTFTADLPPAAFFFPTTAVRPANWFQDTTDQTGGPFGQPAPLAGNQNASPAVGTAVVIRDTLAGDTNLDGLVNLTDLANLATNFGTATGATFARGDTNGDGTVDLTDLSNLATNFNVDLNPVAAGGPPADRLTFAQALAVVRSENPAFAAAVPEPATLAAAVLIGTATLARRRRRGRP